ncbi:MAG: GGDEF domain-containing protein [Actinobacteria bacterium]|nr:GGDEF domain-containing protein [Actinomycetota bacterium]
MLARLEELARTDELTGLPNRRAWDKTIREAVDRAARSDARLCVGVIDIDRFREFNDRHGHQAGDRLLKASAAAWRTGLRKSDTLAVTAVTSSQSRFRAARWRRPGWFSSDSAGEHLTI